MMTMDKNHVPSYPIRLPQYALKRKQFVVKSIAMGLKSNNGFDVKTNVNVDGRYFFDLQVNGKLAEVVTYPDNPNFKIYKRFIPFTFMEIHAEKYTGGKVDVTF